MSSKESHKTAATDKIPNGQKFAYGLGSIVNNLLGGAIGYMSIVLNVGLGINPALVGTLQAIPRLTDALTDPVMGYISDNTRSKYGRRRPYIFIGAIFVGLIFALNVAVTRRLQRNVLLLVLFNWFNNFLFILYDVCNALGCTWLRAYLRLS